LEGDNAAARASLAAIEAARLEKRRDQPMITNITVKYVTPGSVGTGLDALGMAAKLKRHSEDAYYKLKPWVVEAALARLGERRLTVAEQEVVVRATHTPKKVRWPDCWSAAF
jgi:hypothetical protein